MELVLLQSFTNYIDAHIVLGRLQAQGIRCWLKDENVVTVYPIWTNAAGGIKLMVAEDQFTEAQKLLTEFDREKKNYFTCPYCNSGNIELISSNKEPVNWLSVLTGFLFFNYAMAVKIWHCFNCGKEFKEPQEGNGEKE
jgi:DNA-directed RNA polymerase subunit RPC12/RpoP